MKLLENILAFAFTLFGFALLALLLVKFFPVALVLVAIFVIYKAIKWTNSYHKKKHQPNYQSGGYIPKGVAEDHLDKPLSFQTK